MSDCNDVLTDMEDGSYSIEVILQGGSGRASIVTPSEMTVVDHEASVLLEWSSKNYDYMILDGKKYNPVNEEGNSVFELPAVIFDEPVEVIADTTAMSIPHEITYTILLDSSSIEKKSGYRKGEAAAAAIGLFAAVILGIIILRKRKKKRDDI